MVFFEDVCFEYFSDQLTDFNFITIDLNLKL